MRQLVAVVMPDTVTYFLDDGHAHAEQLATVARREMDVTQILELGANLADVLGVNGPAPTPARAPKQLSLPPVSRHPLAPLRRRQQHVLTIEEIVDYVREHPGVRPSEIADDLVDKPGLDRVRRAQVVNNRISSYFDRCKKAGVAPAIRREYGEGGATHLHPA